MPARPSTTGSPPRAGNARSPVCAAWPPSSPQEIGTEEVTGKVIDLGARITNLRATEAALQAIMARATKISGRPRRPEAAHRHARRDRGAVGPEGGARGPRRLRQPDGHVHVPAAPKPTATPRPAPGWDPGQGRRGGNDQAGPRRPTSNDGRHLAHDRRPPDPRRQPWPWPWASPTRSGASSQSEEAPRNWEAPAQAAGISSATAEDSANIEMLGDKPLDRLDLLPVGRMGLDEQVVDFGGDA